MTTPRLINETNEEVYVYVHIYFCDIFRVRHNQFTLGLSMRPKEKVEFKQYLQRSESEHTENAYHLEFDFIQLIVGGKNKGKQYVVCG